MQTADVSQDYLISVDQHGRVVLPASVNIRRAMPDDARALYQAERETSKTPGLLMSLPHELSEQQLRDKIMWLSKVGICLVVEIDGKVIAHAWLDPMCLSQISHVYTLTIVVHPGHTGCGIGTCLMQALTDWATRATRVEKIEWHVRLNNVVAIQLAERFGFVEEGCFERRCKLPDGSYLADVSLAKFY
jgi:putative acetyltransferase